MSRKSVKSLHPTERAPEELDDVKAENQDTKAEIAEDGEEKRRENRHVEDLAVEEESDEGWLEELHRRVAEQQTRSEDDDIQQGEVKGEGEVHEGEEVEEGEEASEESGPDVEEEEDKSLGKREENEQLD